MITRYLTYCFLIFGFILNAQELQNTMTLSEYLGYVKTFHPLVKQANLVVTEGEAKLLKSRGAFDPKIDVDYDRKKFKNTEYFDKLNTTFKIPTWFGIEIKGQLEQNDGVFLNPEANVPTDGLYNVGVSVPVARGLLINERMAVLKQSKLFLDQSKEDRKLLVNEILYKATKAYFNWLRYYNEKEVYRTFLENANTRFKGIKRNFETGQSAAIDTTEARIALNNRKLSLENAKLQLIKAQLNLSNFLWIQDTPVELTDNVIPDVETPNVINDALGLSTMSFNGFDVNAHPKMQSLNYKFEGLRVERRLNRNNLLPKVDLEYNFLSETPEIMNSFNTVNYKAGLNISFPLFLRKERGNLKLANAKMQATEFEIDATRVSLNNKINSINQEIESYDIQSNLTTDIVSDYQKLLTAEERKFTVGESSLFLINSRESKLIEARLKAIEIDYKLFNSKAKLFNNVVFDNL
ncbi:TolC family protein [Ichthyenterobacterium sp. W332]|uniref:TolC family protein n=1 Tax=Microcosmobacter mediterraneus TaxID=3075607 RepID=A0ABU2YJS4_9FLAO|nr:TolC family protein [Ichthyenterobacterium sp. W332]MDT0558425.1 TolC family protein [Ichthyenterobacterium sp. W332]